MKKSPFERKLGIGEKYTNIADVVDDCAEGRPVYLRGYVTASDVILKAELDTVRDWIARGQLHRCVRVF